jgi:hypothetical protein
MCFLNTSTATTHLEVSFNAADKVEYFPPLPTVIAPDGGDEAHDTVQARENKAADDDKRVLKRMIEL